MDEHIKSFSMTFVIVGCACLVAPFLSQDPLHAQRELFSFLFWKRKVGALRLLPTPELPLGCAPVTMRHSLFCMWSEGARLRQWLLCASPCGGEPLPAAPFTPQENRTQDSYWTRQPLLRMFMPGPWSFRTRLLPASALWGQCHQQLGHLLGVFSPGGRPINWLVTEYTGCWGWCSAFIALDGDFFPYHARTYISDTCQTGALFF